MNESDFGGTKIQRKAPPPQMQQQGPPPQQQGPPPQQMMGQMQQPTQQQMMQMQEEQQMMQQMQMQQQQQMRQQGPPPQQMMQLPGKKIKEAFGSVDSKTVKYSILVVLIFLILNSKIIWKQIMKIPLMGSTEPSIIALVVNSILAGIIFYIVTKMLIK